LPRPDWAGKKKVFGNRDERRTKSSRDRSPSHEGRRQADFRQDVEGGTEGAQKPDVVAERPPRPERRQPERPAQERSPEDRPAPRHGHAERAPRREQDARPSSERGSAVNRPFKRSPRANENLSRGDKPFRKPGERPAPKGPDTRKHEGDERKSGAPSHVKPSHSVSKAKREGDEAKPVKSSSPFAKFFREKK